MKVKYAIHIETGNRQGAGTDAKISIVIVGN